MNADQLLGIYASRIQEPPPRGLGRETTTTSQLTEYGQRLFGTDFFRGVFPAGQGPKGLRPAHRVHDRRLVLRRQPARNVQTAQLHKQSIGEKTQPSEEDRLQAIMF